MRAHAAWARPLPRKGRAAQGPAWLAQGRLLRPPTEPSSIAFHGPFPPGWHIHSSQPPQVPLKGGGAARAARLHTRLHFASAACPTHPNHAPNKSPAVSNRACSLGARQRDSTHTQSARADMLLDARSMRTSVPDLLPHQAGHIHACTCTCGMRPHLRAHVACAPISEHMWHAFAPQNTCGMRPHLRAHVACAPISEHMWHAPAPQNTCGIRPHLRAHVACPAPQSTYGMCPHLRARARQHASRTRQGVATERSRAPLLSAASLLLLWQARMPLACVHWQPLRLCPRGMSSTCCWVPPPAHAESDVRARGIPG